MARHNLPPRSAWTDEDVLALKAGLKAKRSRAELAVQLGRSLVAIEFFVNHRLDERLAAIGETPKERPCLRCEKTFMSAGKHNRLCSLCKDNSEFQDNSFTSDHSFGSRR